MKKITIFYLDDPVCFFSFFRLGNSMKRYRSTVVEKYRINLFTSLLCIFAVNDKDFFPSDTGRYLS
jgi:hypothetical protein